MDAGIIRDEEIDLLLNDIAETYGYDFIEYSRASLKRRINRLFTLDKFPSFAELRYKVKTDKEYLKRFVEEITVNVTEMFRDPSFYRTLREQILPELGSCAHIRIWHAGCSTGEEVYSLAIVLQEMGIYHKSLLYATDINPAVLAVGMKGIFPLSQMRLYSENYLLSGGNKEFSSYYSANYEHAKFDDNLRTRMVFSTHNLASDRSFNEFQLILCRNVLIYFEKNLQARVFTLFDDSLVKGGYLALGPKETLRFAPVFARYQQVAPLQKIWKKTV